MVKKVICFALGGHIATQNSSFKRLIELMGSKGYEFYGAEDGFNAFQTGNVHKLTSQKIPKYFSGFVAGAGRYSLTDKVTGKIDENKMDRAIDFFKKGNFDIAVASGGDDHGMQMQILKEQLEDRVGIYVINKTMDNDLGGIDGKNAAPYTDFTNGFHSAVQNGVNIIHQQLGGAWTNNFPTLIGHFSRDANWVGIALAYWGLADKIIYGELPNSHEGHSVEKIYSLILEAQDKNEKRYGRRFATIIVPESTRISGIQHSDEELKDAHGNVKLNPELLVNQLKKELEINYDMKAQTLGITYEMRNCWPTQMDVDLAERSAEEIAFSILIGNENGLESTFKIIDNEIKVGTAPIKFVSEKRYSNYFPEPLIDEDNFEVTNEIGNYYGPLFGDRKRLEDLLPGKPNIVNLFNPKVQ